MSEGPAGPGRFGPGLDVGQRPVSGTGRARLGPGIVLLVGAVVVVVGVLGPRPAPAMQHAVPDPVASPARPATPAPRVAAGVARATHAAPGQALDLGGLPPASTPPGRLPAGAADVVVGFGSAWLVTAADRVLRRLDPETLDVLDEVALPPGTVGTLEPDLVVGGDSVWVARARSSGLLRVDGAQPRTASAIEVGGGVSLVVAGQRAIWAAIADGSLVRVDVRRSGLLGRLRLGSPAVGLAVGRDAVWASTADGVLHRIDPSGRRVTATYPLGGGRIGIGSGAVWVASGSSVVRLDEATGRTQRLAIAVGDAFSAERFTYPPERRESWIAPNRSGLALGLGVWWRWDPSLGVLYRTPRRGS